MRYLPPHSIPAEIIKLFIRNISLPSLIHPYDRGAIGRHHWCCHSCIHHIKITCCGLCRGLPPPPPPDDGVSVKHCWIPFKLRQIACWVPFNRRSRPETTTSLVCVCVSNFFWHFCKMKAKATSPNRESICGMKRKDGKKNQRKSPSRGFMGEMSCQDSLQLQRQPEGGEEGGD